MLSPSNSLAPQQVHLAGLGNPSLWHAWPVLPVVRHRPDGDKDLGCLVDLFHQYSLAGFSATVWLVNYFQLPRTVCALLDAPHETYDTPEEVYAAGWRLD